MKPAPPGDERSHADLGSWPTASASSWTRAIDVGDGLDGVLVEVAPQRQADDPGRQAGRCGGDRREQAAVRLMAVDRRREVAARVDALGAEREGEQVAVDTERRLVDDDGEVLVGGRVAGCQALRADPGHAGEQGPVPRDQVRPPREVLVEDLQRLERQRRVQSPTGAR